MTRSPLREARYRNLVALWCGGVGQPDGMVAGMVVDQLGVVGRGKVENAELGLGCAGADLDATDGGGLLNAADDWGAIGVTSLGDGSGLGDGERDCAGVGDVVVLADGPELAARFAPAGFAISGLPCEVSTSITSTTPTMTATPMAPVTATADRKLTSSIRLYRTLRSRRPPLTTQHHTADLPKFTAGLWR